MSDDCTLLAKSPSRWPLHSLVDDDRSFIADDGELDDFDCDDVPETTRPDAYVDMTAYADDFNDKNQQLADEAFDEVERRLHNFGRCGKWNFCLTARTVVLANQEQQ